LPRSVRVESCRTQRASAHLHARQVLCHSAKLQRNNWLNQTVYGCAAVKDPTPTVNRRWFDTRSDRGSLARLQIDRSSLPGPPLHVQHRIHSTNPPSVPRSPDRSATPKIPIGQYIAEKGLTEGRAYLFSVPRLANPLPESSSADRVEDSKLRGNVPGQYVPRAQHLLLCSRPSGAPRL